MSAVPETVSGAFEAVGDVVGQVGGLVDEVGRIGSEIGKQVSKTVEMMAKDPTKAIALIAVAVIAPELAPLLWEGATIAEAAMVLNTGLQLAQGVDPMTIAQNLATSMATQGLATNLDISTGSFMADKALGSAATAAVQGGDINKAIGSSIGNSLIGMGTGAVSSEIRNFDYKGMYDQAVNDNKLESESAVQLVQGRIFQDAVNAGIDAQEAVEMAKNFDPSVDEYKPLETAAASKEEILNNKLFKDAIESGFTPEEAAAIAKGNIEGEEAGVVGDTSKESLDFKLGDNEITQEQYDTLSPHAADISKSEQEYVDPGIGLPEQEYVDPRSELDAASPIDETATPNTEVPYNALNETIDEAGNKVYTYDDGSTLTMGEDGEVIDVTEATDTGVPDQYEEEADPKSKSGFSLKFGIPKTSSARTVRSAIAPKSGTGTSTTTSAGGLDALGGDPYGVGLTANISRGNADYSLMGETPPPEEGMASGGAVQHMATGSTPSANQGIYDLSTTVSSPFLGGGNQDIMALKPGIIKGKINYGLPGYPFGQEWKAAKTGGAIENAPEGHNPEFFSEGGLGAMQHTYLKGGGDGTSDSIPAMLANGEFVIPADVVSSLGNGSSDSGAKVLDEFLKTIRAHKRKADPKKLPPDSKGPLGYLKEVKKKVKN